jgi:putative DNA primase/helicase
MTSPFEYAARGWKIFPCHSIQRGQCTCSDGMQCGSPGKHPLTEHGFMDASNDITTIRAWEMRFPGANWAVATGRINDLVVIDIDPRNGGFSSIEEYETYRPDGPLPYTLQSLTGGGGKHLFYAYPPEIVIKSNKSKWLKGVDVKAEGGYVMLPESQHISGLPYRWVNWLDQYIWLPPDVAVDLSRIGTGSADGPRGDLAPTSEILQGVPEGERDDVLFREACRLRRQLGDDGRSAVEILILEAARNCSPPFPEAEALRKVEQAFKQDHSDSGDTTHVDGFRKSAGGNGLRLARKFGHKIVYVAGPGWYAWDGSVWRRCDSIEIEPMAKAVVEDLYHLARHPDLTGPERTKAFTFASRTDSPYGIESMIKMARSDEGLLHWPDELDADPYKFAVKNGTVDLRTGELINTSRFDLITAGGRTIAGSAIIPMMTRKRCSGGLARMDLDSLTIWAVGPKSSLRTAPRGLLGHMSQTVKLSRMILKGWPAHDPN